MLFHNPVADREPQSGAVFLGRVERIEDAFAVVLGNPGAGVGEGDENQLAVFGEPGRDGERPTVSLSF